MTTINSLGGCKKNQQNIVVFKSICENQLVSTQFCIGD